MINGLSSSELDIVNRLVIEPLKNINAKVWVFGSRARVDFKKYSDDVQNKIYNVRPGLTGIGSIIFRDEESLISLAAKNEDPHDFYKRVIAPYKGELEIWYHSHRSVFLDFQLIFMTAWVIVSPETRLYEKWFKDLPNRNF